jgi:hypothetical protein
LPSPRSMQPTGPGFNYLSVMTLRSSVRPIYFQIVRKMHIEAIPMRWGTGDNYAYLVTDDKTKKATIIDPAETKEYVADKLIRL